MLIMKYPSVTLNELNFIVAICRNTLKRFINQSDTEKQSEILRSYFYHTQKNTKTSDIFRWVFKLNLSKKNK